MGRSDRPAGIAPARPLSTSPLNSTADSVANYTRALDAAFEGLPRGSAARRLLLDHASLTTEQKGFLIETAVPPDRV